MRCLLKKFAFVGVTLVVGIVIILISLFFSGKMIAQETLASLQAVSTGDTPHVERTIAIFEESRRLHPNEPLVLRRLAEAYLVVGRNEEALSALQDAFRLQPRSGLISQALARAYEASGDTATADSLWARQGQSAERLWQRGRSYAADGSYTKAIPWYMRALRGGLPIDTLRLQVEISVAAILTKASLPAEIQSRLDSLAHSIDTGLLLNGGDLIWMPDLPKRSKIYGELLSAFPSGGTSQGVFWWADQAGTFIRVDHEGDYELMVRAVHVPSPEGQLAVMVDSTPIKVLDLGSAWQEYPMSMSLQPGTHLLRLRYLGNTGNARVRLMTLHPIKK